VPRTYALSDIHGCLDKLERLVKRCADDAGDETAAFVFLGSPAGPSHTPDWMAEGNQVGAQFGACVQAAGDVNGDGYDDVVIGSWQYSNGQAAEGRAYVYCGSDTGLSDTPAWIGESDAGGAAYGYFCRGAGDLNHDGCDDIAVGARRFGGYRLSAARRLYDLSLEYQERSQRSEARLLDEFEGASAGLVAVIGDMIIVDDDDERLSLTTSGFRAEVIPEEAQDTWRTLETTDDLVEFYDPTDVFGDLADALAEAFPSVAPELEGAEGDEGDADDSAAEATEGGAGATTDEGQPAGDDGADA